MSEVFINKYREHYLLRNNVILSTYINVIIPSKTSKRNI